ncbi:Ribokinase-like protein [Kockovaella imperatae]|uniref:Ribokinase-like protein n=1 Tax=Kockovaella imperatae TaxID=4999 RepID=A0A1Y1UD31_9TREE|nr:Ribokinase-like protein [Kockovaella imperatae]ORX34975.1 Ribokinase-like protein [Kockovaella imperatae]
MKLDWKSNDSSRSKIISGGLMQISSAGSQLLVGTDWLSRATLLRRVDPTGMFIIDQFEVHDETGEAVILEEETMGGGGVYAMTAARMFLPPSKCALVVDQGQDFPLDFKDQLMSMGEDMFWFRECQGASTRALNMYSGRRIGDGHQSFKYLSRQAQIQLQDLVCAPSPFVNTLPDYIHLVCLLDRASAVCDELEHLRRKFPHLASWEPKIIWEPLGQACVHANLDKVASIASQFAVFSPNVLEIQSLLSIPQIVSPEAVESAAREFGNLIPDTTVIVRAGPLGSFTVSKTWSGWVPAYWKPKEQDRVIDPTGGGNAWLGGLCAGLLLSKGDIKLGCFFGSAAASFAIEQRGLPHLDKGYWNSDDPWRRLREVAARMDILTRT